MWMVDVFRRFRRDDECHTKVGGIIEASLPDEDIKPLIDIYSPTWRFINKWAENKLQAARVRNDLKRLDAGETALLRGEISVFKEILALPEKQAGSPRPGILNRQADMLAGDEDDR